jgi:hypothetical protein
MDPAMKNLNSNTGPAWASTTGVHPEVGEHVGSFLFRPY